jgi:hypothetical protein
MDAIASAYAALNQSLLGVIWEVSLAEFAFVTLVLGGGGAWLAGRAIGRAWEPAWKAVAWMIPLAAAARFIHYALFSGSLLTPRFYLVDLVALMVLAYLGHRKAITKAMVRQYAWLYERAGPFAWRPRSGA